MAKVFDDARRELDASFTVEHIGGSSFSVLFHSRGGTKGTPEARNTDYNRGLDLVLERLAAAGAVLLDSVVDSTTTRGLPQSMRRLHVAERPYPVELRSIPSVAAYRRAIGRAQAQVGRVVGASGGGNPTKQIRLYVRLPANLGWHRNELERHVSTPRRYFALLAKHSFYDVELAARELETDTWTLPQGHVDAGDRFAIWRTVDPDGRRGIVAFGEVITPPASREESPSSLAYYRGTPTPGPKRRIGLRYVEAPGLPLWLDEDTSGVLTELSVSRGQGTRLFAIALDQWMQLLGSSGADFGDGTPPPGAAAIRSVEDLEDEEEHAIRTAPIPDTERNTLITARRGQGRFRSDVLKLEPRCRVTGIDNERLLIASHIWPWRYATNEERLDPDNGLMLAPHVDKLFDEGLITFTDDGMLLISPHLPQSTVRRLGLPVTANVGTFQGRKAAYLARHRDGIFEK